MPNWISIDGTWFPSKEHVVLPHLSGTNKEVYDGPDRAALYELYQIDKSGETTTLGQDFHDDRDLINRVKQLGYNSVDEYAEKTGWSKEKSLKDLEKKASIIAKHELPKRIKAIETLGGGADLSGNGNNRYGGFGEPKELSK